MPRVQKLEGGIATVTRGVRVVDALFYDPCPPFISLGGSFTARGIVIVSVLRDGVKVKLRLWYIKGITVFPMKRRYWPDIAYSSFV